MTRYLIGGTPQLAFGGVAKIKQQWQKFDSVWFLTTVYLDAEDNVLTSTLATSRTQLEIDMYEDYFHHTATKEAMVGTDEEATSSTSRRDDDEVPF